MTTTLPDSVGQSEGVNAFEKGLDKAFNKLVFTFDQLGAHVSPDGLEQYEEVKRQLRVLREHVGDLVKKGKEVMDISLIDEKDLPERRGEDEWKKLGSGAFGTVFKITFQGNPSAIKIFQEDFAKKIRETHLLRGLSHDNIIAYRGMGQVTGTTLLSRITEDFIRESYSASKLYRFLIMEYLPFSLEHVVLHKNLDDTTRKGLSDDRTCMIGSKITNALTYLHAKDIAHRDLKPDNILYDPARQLVKLADFGLAWQDQTTSLNPGRGSVISSKKHIRWGAPEFFVVKETVGNMRIQRPDRYKRGDIWSLGMIIVFCITAEKPFSSILESHSIPVGSALDADMYTPIDLPENLPLPLKSIAEDCRQIDPAKRPTAENILFKFRELEKSLEPPEQEFFTCGFLTKTSIFVADSCVTQDAAGFLESRKRPEGYNHGFLLCPVETKGAPLHPVPPAESEWEYEENYREFYIEFKKKAAKKIIDDNPFVALKKLTISRPGKEEVQLLELSFEQSSYCHHRAMREIWTKILTPEERRQLVPCKNDVNYYYSTSFGLHVAILTKEPAGPQKFVFCRRSRRAGMSSPGVITCGAVEGISINDIETLDSDGSKRVNLVTTAVRGLHEELGLELTGSELDAITLNTVYLKFDTHEWGLCGFVDLSDKRINEDHRLSATNLEYRFTAGPKDKFEHQSIIPVDFTLDNMVDFVFANQHDFASSAKLVVVKVMQAFFGVDKVEREFQIKAGK